MFTRQHYVAIARVMKAAAERERPTVVGQLVVEDVAARLAEMFADDNGSFNRQRFMDACTPDESPVTQ